MKKYKTFFYLMLMIILTMTVIALLPSLLLQILNYKHIELQRKHILFIVAAITLSNGINLAMIAFREKFASDYNRINCMNYISDLLNVNYDSIISEGPTHLIERIIVSVNHIYLYMTGQNVQIWSSIVTSLLSILILTAINYKISILMTVYLPFISVSYRMLNKRLETKSKTMQEVTGRSVQKIISYLDTPDYYKQLDDYSYLLNDIEPAVAAMYRSMRNVNVFAQTVSGALQSVGTILQNLISLYLIYQFYKGRISPYILMMSNIILPLFFSASSAIANASVRRSDYSTALQFQEHLHSKAEAQTGKNISSIDSIELSVSELQIGAKTFPFFAQGILRKGEIGQICGKSGTGKSTLAKALVKFRDIKGIKLNHMDIRELSALTIRKKTEYVSQNIPIVSGTLRDNLFLGKKESSVSSGNMEILKMLFVNKTLDSEILENGANLSGGEKQKIAIVRALINKPELLILDEVCSNIDQQSAEEIYSLLNQEKESRITILITHDTLPDFLDVKKLI